MSRDIDDDGTDLPRVPLVVATDILTRAAITFEGGGCKLDLGHGVVILVDAEGAVSVGGKAAMLEDLVRRLYDSWSQAEARIAAGMDLTTAQDALLLDVIGGR